MDESGIVNALFRRDEAALKEAESKYRAYCLYIASNILRDVRDREECFSDTLLALWNSVPPQRPADLKSYIGKLMRRICIDKWRAGNAKKRVKNEFLRSLDELESVCGAEDPESELLTKELSGAISAYLRLLPQEERAVFVSRYWYYEPVAEIAERFGYGKSKVKMMLKRTRERLAEHLKKEGYTL